MLNFMYSTEMAYVKYKTKRYERLSVIASSYVVDWHVSPQIAGYLLGHSPGGGEHDAWLSYVGKQRMHMQAPATRMLMWLLLGQRVVPGDFLTGPADASREHELLGEPWVEIV